MFCAPLLQTISLEAKDVGVIEEAMHLCFSLGLLHILLLVTQDSLQCVEVSIM